MPSRVVLQRGEQALRILLTIGLLVLPAIAAASDAERPNIVFLFSDDQTEFATGCYGNQQIQTPELDRLASDGLRFTNHYNSTAICMASRCSVLTGLYEYRHGCNFGHGNLEERFFASSYPVRLREAGYMTGFAGKVGFLIEGRPFDDFEQQFDWFAGGPGQTFYETRRNKRIADYADRYPHSSRAYGAWAVDFLKAARESGQPFCLSISFKAPHLPFTPDPADLHLYQDHEFVPPLNYGVAHAAHLSPQSRTSRAFNSYREWVNDYNNTIANYYRLIYSVDAAVGMIRKGLTDCGLADNTVIIYTSDNGYNCGAHGFGDKVLPYEEASKSPLIIFDPRVSATTRGQSSAALTSQVDMAATILDLAGLLTSDIQRSIDGQSLLPLVTGEQRSVRHYLPLFNFWGIPSAQSTGVMKINALWQAGSWREVQSCCTVGCDSSPLPPQVGSLLLDVAWGDEGQGEKLQYFSAPSPWPSPAAKPLTADEGTLRGRGDEVCAAQT
jgi:arylsulfatase A-like enzyme